MAPRRRKRTAKRTSSTAVTRGDLTGVLDQLRQHAHNLDIQFRRIADIQADIDELKRRMKRKK